ncbi:hypothetical protein [Hanstruepera ponticola]|uniref:hypothetical protein n=1 Tax=Hanstruepera ponticola TaxID=2042995 RepID=UPI0017814C51|nr:hypothetical protein [Hanstruepera ponticola]
MRYLFLSLFAVFLFQIPNEKDFINYHQEYNNIEDLIVEEKFEEAEVLLNALLISYSPPFAKDYVIAAEICLLNNNNEQATYWIKESIKKGVKVQCLKDIDVFRDKLNNSDWSRLESDLMSLQTAYLSSIRIGLSKTIHRNYQKEQLSKKAKNYKGIVYSNFKKIKELLNENTYPGENLIGIDNSDDASKIDDCSFDNSKITVTLLHYTHPIYELTEEKLIEFIKKGSLHPREFAQIYTFEKNRISKLYKTSIKTGLIKSDYNFKFPFEKRKSDSQRVNKDRSNFGICSLETDRKKTEIEEKYGIKLKFGYK